MTSLIISALLLVMQVADPIQVSRQDPVVLPDAHSLVLWTKEGGKGYRVYVALPPGYSDSTKRYPVLYTLDAHAGFALLAQTYRLLRVDPSTPDVVLVGIGYDESGPERQTRRMRDLTPTRAAFDADTGGGAAFIAFLRDTVIPYVDATYRTLDDRGIHGHSLGGVFALYALLRHPDIFSRYIISSPSLWWDDAVMLEYAASPAPGRPSGRSVFLSVGAAEAEDMRAHFRPFVESLRGPAHTGLTVTAEVLADEDHLSVFGPAFVRGLRAVYRSP